MKKRKLVRYEKLRDNYAVIELPEVNMTWVRPKTEYVLPRETIRSRWGLVRVPRSKR